MRGIREHDASARERGPGQARAALAWLGGIACAVLMSSPIAGPSGAEAVAEAAPSFHSREGGFSARFPEAPRYEEKRESTLLGVLRTRSWEVERGALRLRIERHDVPALATVALGDEALLERAARELLADLGARAARDEAARLREHPGRHLRYEPGERPGETEDAWLYLLGHRLYVIFARGANPTTRAAALRFASSVELLED